jgi:hypothetical protein
MIIRIWCYHRLGNEREDGIGRAVSKYVSLKSKGEDLDLHLQNSKRSKEIVASVLITAIAAALLVVASAWVRQLCHRLRDPCCKELLLW